MLKDNSQQQDIYKFMQKLKPFQRGSLRWVREEIWERYSERKDYRRNPNKQHHPGCVINTPTFQNPAIVFIHGHSKASHPLRYELSVKDITEPGRTSYFSVHRRYPVPPSVAWARANVSEDYLYKTMLDKKELKKLKTLETLYNNEGRAKQSKRSKRLFKTSSNSSLPINTKANNPNAGVKDK